jgi:hypothetical protein
MEIIIRQETGGKERYEKTISAEAAGASLAVNITRG